MKWLVLVLLVVPAESYWSEECKVQDPEYALPDNKELDCSIRQVAFDHATKVLNGRGTARVHKALNLQVCNVSLPAATPVASHYTGASGNQAEIFVSPTGSDHSGDGSSLKPFRTLLKAQSAARMKPGGVIVWLREGTYFQNETLLFTPADSGSLGSPTTYAGYPGEKATISGGAPIDASTLEWEPVAGAGGASKLYKAKLPASFNNGHSFTGLFWNGSRLTRARYPNCVDITGTECYTLNASGHTFDLRTPTRSLNTTEYNLNVVNQDGVDMFADYDAKSDGTPHGASDSTVLPGEKSTLTVEHADYAWRCHEDCGWGAFSKWQNQVCPASVNGAGDWNSGACRMDPTFNEPFWDQQVSGGFFFNVTAKEQPWAPAWTEKTWEAEGVKNGIVHMYHSARWGGWQFKLHSRNDSDHSLNFQCNLFDDSGKITAKAVACPAPGVENSTESALVLGGWQEARGWTIGPRYTNTKLNNSYFIENILEECDYPGEWYLQDATTTTATTATAATATASAGDRYLYIVLPSGVTDPKELKTLVATSHKRVVEVRGSAADPVSYLQFQNLTIAHAALTYMDRYEVPSGGDWSIHRGAAVFVDGALELEVNGCLFDQVRQRFYVQ
jgi:hypothetical protein